MSNSNNKSYICGITIGPIVDTLNMTSTPGGLWTASYLFSYVAKSLIKELYSKNNIKLLLPYFDKTFNNLEESVGSYPDHIIFRINIDETEGNYQAQINDIIKGVKVKVAKLVADSLKGSKYKTTDMIKEYMEQYISIHCVILEDIWKQDKTIEPSIMEKVSEVLDNVELSKTYVKDAMNYLLDFFSGTEGHKNHYIHKFFINTNNLNKIAPQVLKRDYQYTGGTKDENNILSIEDIADIEGKKDYKISDYYAIVYADGDGMSNIFKEMKDTDLVKFSKACINYTKKSANLIKEYGGVTVYAGGDDLLFIAPLLSKDGKKRNILNLCSDIKDSFNDDVIEGKELKNLYSVHPTVSFGISINYKKYPLYEALDQARDMLFNKAKKMNADEKNAIALRLTKASGQSMMLVFNNNSDTLSEFKTLLKDYFIDVDNKVALERVTSVIYLIDNYQTLFKKSLMEGKTSMENFFVNMYDNPNQSQYKSFINKITDLYIKAAEDKKSNKFISIINSVDIQKDRKINTEHSALLRFAKFFVEKAGDKL